MKCGPKKAPPGRGRFKGELRRAKVARLYIGGLKHVEIAERVGVSPTQVGHDLRKIRQIWLEAAICDFNAAKAEQLARIDEVERNAWREFRRSCRDVVETEKNMVGRTGQMQSRKIKHKKQTGDPAYLKLVLDCVERRSKILGLEAPIKVAPTKVNGTDLSLDERKSQLVAILHRASHAGTDCRTGIPALTDDRNLADRDSA